MNNYFKNVKKNGKMVSLKNIKVHNNNVISILTL